MRILTTPDTPFNLDIHKGREADHSQVRSVANRLIVLRGAQFSAPLLRDALFIDLEKALPWTLLH
jgi:hypothetical protein